MARESYFTVLTAAIADVAEHGFDSVERLNYWRARLRKAAIETLGPLADMERLLSASMAAVYARLVDRGGITSYHPGLGQFTLEKIRPALRAELDRRILASADLIKLNRELSIETTLRRFSGWATSIPKGGSDIVAKAKTKTAIRKPLAAEYFSAVAKAIDIDLLHRT